MTDDKCRSDGRVGGIGKDQAVEIARSFLFGGMRLRRGSRDDAETDDVKVILKRARRIIHEEQGTIKPAFKAFRSDGDLDAFLSSLCKVHTRIFYEAYGDYWLKHCIPIRELAGEKRVDRDADAEFTFYNDIIDMYWVGKWQEWKKNGEWCVTIMLPPTAGLMRAAYRKEMKCYQT